MNVLLEQSLSFNFIILQRERREKKKEAPRASFRRPISIFFFFASKAFFCVLEVLQHRVLSLSFTDAQTRLQFSSKCFSQRAPWRRISQAADWPGFFRGDCSISRRKTAAICNQPYLQIFSFVLSWIICLCVTSRTFWTIKYKQSDNIVLFHIGVKNSLIQTGSLSLEAALCGTKFVNWARAKLSADL